MKTVNLKQLFKLNQKKLESSGILHAKFDLELIFAHVLKTTKNKLFLIDNITAKQARKINALVKKRKKYIPVQYLLKNVEFLNLILHVNKNVLIPRNETEQLADLLIKDVDSAKKNTSVTALDMCCGSGAIGLALAKNAKVFVDLADISASALKVARKNAKANKIDNVNFIKTNLFNRINRKYDFFVANPPYIKTSEIEGLQKQVKQFEPKKALDGGESGLVFFEKIILNLSDFLNNNATVFFEVGFDQAKNVADCLKQKSFKKIEIIKDYYGHERFVKAKFLV